MDAAAALHCSFVGFTLVSSLSLYNLWVKVFRTQHLWKRGAEVRSHLVTQMALVYITFFSKPKSLGLREACKTDRTFVHQHTDDRMRFRVICYEDLANRALPGVADTDAMLDHNPAEHVNLYPTQSPKISRAKPWHSRACVFRNTPRPLVFMS